MNKILKGFKFTFVNRTKFFEMFTVIEILIMSNINFPKHTSELHEIMPALRLYYEAETWQTNKEHVEKLKEKYVFSFWEKVDDAHSAVRFCTSWATKAENVEELIRDVEALS